MFGCGEHPTGKSGWISYEVDEDGENYCDLSSVGNKADISGLNDGRWHHIVGTRQGPCTELFVDGVSCGVRKCDSGQAANITTGDHFKFGQSYCGFPEVEFAVRDFKLWREKSLSAQEVQSVYASQHHQ